MRVVERRVQWIRSERRGIVPVELDERRGQIDCRSIASGVLIGLEFMLARIHRRYGFEEKSEWRQYQREQYQRHCRGGRDDAQTLEEPFLVHEKAQQPEEPEAQGKAPCHSLDDVF